MLDFTISSMTCGHCASRVTQAVKSADPEAGVDVDLATHQVRVQTDKDRDTMIAALTDAGYAPD